MDDSTSTTAKFNSNPAQIMYSVRPVLDKLSVNPAQIMYHVKGYHEDAADSSEAMGDCNANSNEQTALSTVDGLEKKQLELINQLMAFIDRINKSFSIRTKNVDDHGDVKKSKAAKLSAKKSTAHSNHSAEPFFYYEESTGNSKADQSLRACMTPVLPNFDVAPVPGDIVLCLCNEDRQWLNVLAKLGSHRGVTYTGELVNESAVKGVFNVIVNYSATNPFDIGAKVNGESLIHGRIAIMKFIGSITGLVSFSKSTALQLAGVDFWLLTADKLVSNQVSIEDICRLLSNNLSSSDFLGAQYVPNITDVVMFSLVDGQTNVSNNVELWLKRMRKLLN